MRRDGWTVALLCREALANIGGPAARGLPLLGAAILIGLAGVAFAAVESSQRRAALVREALLGRNLLVITSSVPEQPAQIDRRSCEAVARDADVDRAGVLTQTTGVDLPQIGANVPVFEGSPSLFPALRNHAAVIGAALRRPGPPIDLIVPGGVLPAAVVGARQPEAIGTDTAVVVGIPPSVSTSGSCTVVLRPTAAALPAQRRIVAELASAGPALAVLDQFEEPVDPIDAFLSRATRFLPYLLAAAGGVASGVLGRLRTGEWAAYRLTGTSPRSMVVIVLLEQWLVAGTMVASAALTVLLLHGRLIDPVGRLLDEVAAGALWVLVAAAMTAGLALRPPTLLAKE